MQIKKILSNIFILSILLSTFSFADNELKDLMNLKLKNINEILIFNKNNTLNLKEKKEKLLLEVENIMDFKVMSMIALGNNWKTITNEERNEFTNVFQNNLKTSFLNKLELFLNSQFIFKNIETINTKKKVITEIKFNNETAEVVFKFYKNKNLNLWKIYDVEISSISLMKTYKVQFNDYLEKNSIKNLINYLKEI